MIKWHVKVDLHHISEAGGGMNNVANMGQWHDKYVSTSSAAQPSAATLYGNHFTDLQKRQ